MYVSTKVQRSSRAIGDHLKRQRKLMGLTTQIVAERADITLPTLRKIESGEPVRSEALLSVLNVLGLLDSIVAASDPFNTDVGRLRADEILPTRVRTR